MSVWQPSAYSWVIVAPYKQILQNWYISLVLFLKKESGPVKVLYIVRVNITVSMSKKILGDHKYTDIWNLETPAFLTFLKEHLMLKQVTLVFRAEPGAFNYMHKYNSNK